MIQPVEVVWTTITMVGFIVSLFAVGDALGDARLVSKQNVNGPRRAIARANLRREVMRSVMFIGWTAAGFGVMFSTTPAPPGIRLLTIGSIIMGAVLTVATTVLDRVTRYRVLHYDDNERS